MADFAVIKQRQQQVWATGNYTTVGNTLVLVSEFLCEAVNVRAGQRVLDVATGSGNTALAAARRWCEVTGVDYVPALLYRSPEHWLEVFRTTFGPVMAAFRGLDASGQARLGGELLAVAARMDRSGDATMAVPSEYLEVVATRR